MYLYVPETGTFQSTTKGHSVLRQRPYSPGLYRRPIDELYDYTYVRRHLPYDTSGNENYTRSEVNRELYLSSAALDDTFDIAARSRNRDRDVLNAANKAIVATETYQSPRSSVAARRAQRGHAQPVVYSSPKNVEKKEVVLVRARVNPNVKRQKPPASLARWPTRASSVPPSRYAKVVALESEGGDFVTPRAPIYTLAYLRHLEMKLLGNSIIAASRAARKVPYVPHRRVKKAALVGRKVDIVRPDRKRPKSQYAQAKMRQIHLERRDENAPSAVGTASLRASRPVF